MAHESWAERSVLHLNTAYAPAVHSPVATALGLLLPHTRRYLGLQNVSPTHNCLCAFHARIRRIVSPGALHTRAHERRPRQCQGGGEM